MVHLTGVEPATSSLENWCYYQLSYYRIEYKYISMYQYSCKINKDDLQQHIDNKENGRLNKKYNRTSRDL